MTGSKSYLRSLPFRERKGRRTSRWVDGLKTMARTLALNLSRAVEADGDPTILNDHRNFAHSVREP